MHFRDSSQFGALASRMSFPTFSNGITMFSFMVACPLSCLTDVNLKVNRMRRFFQPSPYATFSNNSSQNWKLPNIPKPMVRVLTRREGLRKRKCVLVTN